MIKACLTSADIREKNADILPDRRIDMDSSVFIYLMFSDVTAPVVITSIHNFVHRFRPGVQSSYS